MSLAEELRQVCSRARAASRELAILRRSAKDGALRSLAVRLRDPSVRRAVLAANAEDVAAARAADMAEPLVDRLLLDGSRLDAMAAALEEIASFDDPIGEVI